MAAAEACAGCGWLGGAAGCRARFEQALARDFSNPLFFATHRLLVDAYALQHPDEYCRSAKSLAAHLVGLFLILEGETGTAIGAAHLRSWLDGPVTLEKPPIPPARGEVTLGDLAAAGEPAQWREALLGWARSIWQAYRPLHDLARDWAAQAGAGRERRSR